MTHNPWLLWRYLAKQFTLWLLAISVCMGVILSIFDGVELFRRTIGRQVAFDTLVGMILFKVPSLIEQLLPLILFFSAFLCYLYLNKRLELVCMRAAGVSLAQLIVPALFVTVALGGVYLFILNPLSSALYSRYERIEDALFKPNQESLSLLSSGIWFQRYDGGHHYIVHGKKAVKENQTLRDITLFDFDAASGELLERRDSPLGTLTDGVLRLQDATSTVTCPAPPATSHPTPRKKRDLQETAMAPLTCYSPDHTELDLNLSFQSLEGSLASPKTFSLFALPTFIRSLESMGFSSIKHKAHWYKILSTPFIFIAMVLWGIYFAYPWQRHQKPLSTYGTPSLAVFALFIISEVFRNLGTSGVLTPGVATIASVGLILVLVCVLLLRLQDT